MIVVDSNIVAYLYLPSAYTERVESLFGHDSDWAAPILWRSEFRNILIGYLRQKLISFEQDRALLRAFPNFTQPLPTN